MEICARLSCVWASVGCAALAGLAEKGCADAARTGTFTPGHKLRSASSEARGCVRGLRSLASLGHWICIGLPQPLLPRFSPGLSLCRPFAGTRESQRKRFSFALLGERAETELAQGWDCDNGLAEQLGLLWDCWSGGC